MVDNEKSKEHSSIISKLSPEVLIGFTSLLIGFATLLILGLGAWQWNSHINGINKRLDGLDAKLDSRLSEERKYFTDGINRLSEKDDKILEQTNEIDKKLTRFETQSETFSNFLASYVNLSFPSPAVAGNTSPPEQ